ncbi:MAG: hypothetical protein LBG65_06920 [Puniceicoccales bacterium]|jgi:C-terminal processing protease CtpA/Prc|nr:hypothetical protein [Puniceicoccales bacterium]
MRPLLRSLLIFLAIAPWGAGALSLGVFLLRNPDARHWFDRDFLRAWGRVGHGMLLVHTRYLEPEKAAPDALAERALGAMAHLDRYSGYLSPENYDDFKQRANQTRIGIGADIQVIERLPVIVRIHAGGGAGKAGLLPGDRLLAAGGEPLDGLDKESVLRVLNQGADTPISLTVQRLHKSAGRTDAKGVERPPAPPSASVENKAPEAETKPTAAGATGIAAAREETPGRRGAGSAPPEGRAEVFVRSVARLPTRVPTVEDVRLLDDGATGYARITEFKRHTAAELSSALHSPALRQASALVLDLRDNTGGNIESAVDSVGHFCRRGTHVAMLLERGGREARPHYHTHADPVAPDLPLAILVNARTASSAEIFSGALQDLGRAVVVGTPTRGKHVAQSVYALGAKDGLRLTTAQYVLPSGRTTRGGGIRPDIEQAFDWRARGVLKSAEEWGCARRSACFQRLFPAPAPRDPQLSAALDYLRIAASVDSRTGGASLPRQ